MAPKKNQVLEVGAPSNEVAPKLPSTEPVIASMKTKPASATNVASNGTSHSEESESSPSRNGAKYEIPDGLTKSQKKNLKKKLREKEKKAEEAAGIRRGVPQLPEDPLQPERVKVVQSVTRTLCKLPSMAEMKPSDVVERFRQQQDILQDLLNTIIEAQENLCTKIKKPDNRRMASSQLLERIRELSALQEHDEGAVDYLEDQLVLMVSWENARKFQSQLVDVRQKIEDRQRSNQRSFDGALAWQKKGKLVDRVKVLKQLHPDGCEDVENIAASKVTTVEIEVAPEAQVVLLPPLNIYRRMEKVFAVAVDRSPDKMRQRTFLISGLEKDVDEAVEFLQQSDFSGSCKVAVDAKLLPQLIGKGGSGIRQLEETFKCFFQTRDNNDVVVYGAKVNAAKAVQHISQLKVEKTTDLVVAVVPVDHSAIARSLTTLFSKEIRDMEAKYAVGVRVSSGPPRGASHNQEAPFGADVSTEAPRKVERSNNVTSTPAQTSVLSGPTVTIRGNSKQAVEAARNAITKILSSLRVVEIRADSPDVMRRLFTRVTFNGEVDLVRGIRSPTATSNQPSIGDRFCDLVGLNSDVAFIRCGDALAIVGSPERIKDVHDETKGLVEAAGYTSSRVNLHTRQLPVFSSARLAEISEATGASLTVRRPRSIGAGVSNTSDNCSIEILGNETQKEEATKLVNDIIDDEAIIEVMHISDLETFYQLLQAKGTAIRALENQFGTRLYIDRNDMTCTVVGRTSGIGATCKALREMDEKNAQLETRSLAIPSSTNISRLIGTKGATVTQIRNSSKVETIEINDADMVVVIRGTREACDEAERQINDIYNLAQRAPRAALSTSAPVAPRAHKPQTVVATAPPASGLRWGESVPEEQQPSALSPESVSPNGRAGRGWVPSGAVRSTVASEAAFPSLGEAADIGKQSKRPNRRRRPNQQVSVAAQINNESVEGNIGVNLDTADSEIEIDVAQTTKVSDDQ